MFAVTFGFLTYYALHHGSYSLIDRQTNAVILWVMIGAGAAFGIFPAVRQPRVAWLPFFALLAMAVWTLIALSWTESAERTVNEFARILGYLGVVGLVLLTVGRRSWRMAAAGLLTAGVLVCCLTLLSRLWPSIFPVDTVSENFGTSRISYPFGYWNAVGCWASMTIAMCVAYAAHARSWVVRALALGAVPVCACVLYLTLSRAGVGGLVIGVVVSILLGKNRWLAAGQTAIAAAVSLAAVLMLRGQSELVDATGTGGAWTVIFVVASAAIVLGAVAAAGHQLDLGKRLRMSRGLGRTLGVAGAAVALMAGVFLLASYGGQVWDEFKGTTELTQAATDDGRLGDLSGNRYNIYASSVEAFESAKLGGRGPGTFEFWWSRNGTNAEFVRDTHSIYLEALAETGTVGLALLLLFFGAALTAALIARRNLLRRPSSDLGVQAGLIAVFAVFLLQAGVDWMWESTAVAVLALLAITMATCVSGSTRSRVQSASLSVGMVVTAVVAVILLLPGLSAERQIEKSQVAFRDGDLSAAVRFAKRAAVSESWSANAHAQLALVHLANGDLEDALTSIAICQKLEPFNWRWPLVGTRIAVAAGDPASAARSYRRAQALRKNRSRR